MSDNDWLEGDKALVLATAHLEEAIGSEDASAGFEMDGKRKEADRYVARAHALAAIAQASATLTLVQAIDRQTALLSKLDEEGIVKVPFSPMVSSPIDYLLPHRYEPTRLASSREVCAGCGYSKYQTGYGSVDVPELTVLQGDAGPHLLHPEIGVNSAAGASNIR